MSEFVVPQSSDHLFQRGEGVAGPEQWVTESGKWLGANFWVTLPELEF